MILVTVIIPAAPSIALWIADGSSAGVVREANRTFYGLYVFYLFRLAAKTKVSQLYLTLLTR